MNKTLLITLLVMVCMVSSYAQTDSISRPKIGVVLSGGGAKGFAHVGVLKVLEKAGIPVDIIGGTSIGSIVGGLYAMGYTADQIEDMIKSQDWELLLSDKVSRKYNPFFEKEEQDRYSVSFPITPNGVALPSSLNKGQNLHKLFSKLAFYYHDTRDFSKLPIPFFCIATDINTGEEVILDKGYLPWCIKASMAVPMAFEPMEIDGRQLVDGGIRNNYPVDVMLDKGADIIIGVDITDGLERQDNSQLGMGHTVGQLINLFGHDKYLVNTKECDISIKPDITGFSGASFSNQAADSLMVRGEVAAREFLPALIALCDSLHLKPNHFTRKGVFDADTTFRIKNIVFHGVENTNMKFIKGKMDIEPGSEVSINMLEKGIDRAYGSKLFDYISYRLEGDEERILHLYVKEAYANAYNIGLHYDNIDDASLLLNGTWRNYITGGSRLSVNMKLATNISAYAEYTVDRGVLPGYSIEARYNDLNMTMYDKGDKIGNLNIRYSFGGLSLHSIFWDRFALGIGTRFEYIDLRDVVIQEEGIISDNYVWHHVHRGFLKLDTRDDIYFPKSGFNIDGEVQLVTENGFLFEEDVPPLIAKLSYLHVVTPFKQLTQIFQLNSRIIFGGDVPIYYETRLGGHEQFDYFDMMIPFVGLRYGELSVQNAVAARYDLRYNFYKKHYVTGKFNIALTANDLEDLCENGTFIYGGGLSYSTSSFIGPIEVNLMMSDYYNRLNTFISVGYWF